MSISAQDIWRDDVLSNLNDEDKTRFELIDLIQQVKDMLCNDNYTVYYESLRKDLNLHQLSCNGRSISSCPF
jgi:hypothetical protein